MRFVALFALLAAAASGTQLSERDRALFAAARTGDAAGVRRLLRQGAEATVRDERGRSALHEASASGNVDAVRALVAAGADPGARERSGWTPLMDAARAGRLAAVEALLEAGADSEARDRAAGTVLDVAQQAGQDDVVSLLRRHGARGSGKSVGDHVCVRPWKDEGFCGTVERVQKTRTLVRVTSIVGCERGCAPDAECSSGRAVGGDSADAVVTGASVWTPAWCLTHTGLP